MMFLDILYLRQYLIYNKRSVISADQCSVCQSKARVRNSCGSFKQNLFRFSFSVEGSLVLTNEKFFHETIVYFIILTHFLVNLIINVL